MIAVAGRFVVALWPTPTIANTWLARRPQVAACKRMAACLSVKTLPLNWQSLFELAIKLVQDRSNAFRKPASRWLLLLTVVAVVVVVVVVVVV